MDDLVRANEELLKFYAKGGTREEILSAVSRAFSGDMNSILGGCSMNSIVGGDEFGESPFGSIFDNAGLLIGGVVTAAIVSFILYFLSLPKQLSLVNADPSPHVPNVLLSDNAVDPSDTTKLPQKARFEVIDRKQPPWSFALNTNLQSSPGERVLERQDLGEFRELLTRGYFGFRTGTVSNIGVDGVKLSDDLLRAGCPPGGTFEVLNQYYIGEGGLSQQLYEFSQHNVVVNWITFPKQSNIWPCETGAYAAKDFLMFNAAPVNGHISYRDIHVDLSRFPKGDQPGYTMDDLHRLIQDGSWLLGDVRIQDMYAIVEWSQLKHLVEKTLRIKSSVAPNLKLDYAGGNREGKAHRWVHGTPGEMAKTCTEWFPLLVSQVLHGKTFTLIVNCKDSPLEWHTFMFRPIEIKNAKNSSKQKAFYITITYFDHPLVGDPDTFRKSSEHPLWLMEGLAVNFMNLMEKHPAIPSSYVEILKSNGFQQGRLPTYKSIFKYSLAKNASHDDVNEYIGMYDSKQRSVGGYRTAHDKTVYGGDYRTIKDTALYIGKCIAILVVVVIIIVAIGKLVEICSMNVVEERPLTAYNAPV